MAREVLCLLKEFGRLLRTEWPWILAVAGLTAVIIWLMIPVDDELLRTIKELRDDDAARGLAEFFGTYGDYPFYSLLMMLAFFLVGIWRKQEQLVRIGLAIFLGASLAGLFGNSLRVTVGRPRPNVAEEVPDGVYGIQGKNRFHSFPSGHASTAFGTASAISAACPPLAMPALAIAGATAWARVHQKAHRPTDIIGSMLLGVIIGGMFGFLARKRNLRNLPLGANSPPAAG